MNELTSKIGQKVTFSPQGNIIDKGGVGWIGKIIDEIWITPDLNKAPPHDHPCSKGSPCEGDYSFCAQRIKWKDTKGTLYKTNIRLAYYYRSCDKEAWIFGGQTTVCTDPPTVYALLTQTLAKNAWFDIPKATGSN